MSKASRRRHRKKQKLDAAQAAEMQPPTQTPRTSGGLGGSSVASIDSRTPGKDIRLIGAALRNRWQLPDEAFTSLPDAMLGIALDTNMEPRVRVGSARVFTAMHGQNEDADRPDGVPDPSVNVTVNNQVNIVEATNAAAKGMLNEPEYLDYLRDCAVTDDAGLICQNGQPEHAPAVANGQTPVVHRPGNNGHAHGSNGVDPGH